MSVQTAEKREPKVNGVDVAAVKNTVGAINQVFISFKIGSVGNDSAHIRITF